jgi:hypothetical protein
MSVLAIGSTIFISLERLLVVHLLKNYEYGAYKLYFYNIVLNNQTDRFCLIDLLLHNGYPDNISKDANSSKDEVSDTTMLPKVMKLVTQNCISKQIIEKKKI